MTGFTQDKPKKRGGVAALAGGLRYRLATYPEAVALVTLGLVFGFFALAADNFLTGLALANVLTYSSINGIIVVGVVTLMVSGEFDLSVGSTFAVASYVFAIALNHALPPVLAMLAALVVSAGLGALNGWLVTRWEIPSFIATLGTLLAYRGLARWLGEGDPVQLQVEGTPWLLGVLNGPLAALNALFTPAANFRTSALWFVLVVVVMSVVMTQTRLGNRITATGGNPGAARAQGINTGRVKLIAFTLCGLLAGLAGVVQFAQLQSVDPLRGDGLELIAVAAAVIGGARLSGGFGTVAGAAFGVLLLGVLNQGLVLMGAPLQVFRAIAGAFVIVSVIVSNAIQGD